MLRGNARQLLERHADDPEKLCDHDWTFKGAGLDRTITVAFGNSPHDRTPLDTEH